MDEHLRLSDTERERAATDLGEHYAAGRLTTEEHAERLDRIWAARTRGELGPVFGDLPGAGRTDRPVTPARRTAATAPSWRRRRPPVPLFPLLLVLVLVAALTPAPWLIVLPALVLVMVVRGSHRSSCAR